MKPQVLAGLLLGLSWAPATTHLSAHEGGHGHGHESPQDAQEIVHDTMPEIGKHFLPFERELKIRWDDDYLLIGSDGLPQHPMMIGITSWQQQVPLPQKYFGRNTWRVPLRPVPAKKPRTTKNAFLRGAIALAVNGVPIFNPLNNRGDDAFLFGELDEYGGHCGRADDYHYHTAPVHLETHTGKGNPIAYALDGYPIVGYQDETEPNFAPLDRLGGHKNAAGEYHYHAQRTYPYLNGGFYGVVNERGGQVDPQPRAEPVRPDLRPLRGATITGFSRTGNRFELVYDVNDREGVVKYVARGDGQVDFTFEEPSGTTRSETYQSRRGESFLFRFFQTKNFQGWSAIAGSFLAALVALVVWRNSRRQTGKQHEVGERSDAVLR